MGGGFTSRARSRSGSGNLTKEIGSSNSNFNLAMETHLHPVTATTLDLLAVVERQTGRRFLGGHHRQELVTAWFDGEKHSWFSSRPFPQGTDSLPPSRRLGSELPDNECFLRFDLELPCHSAIPTDADISAAVAQALSLGALGAVHTPRGLHVYVLASRPLSYTNGEVRHFLQALWPKNMALKVCSASWSRNNWSRYVPELIFFRPTARIDVDSIFLVAPVPTESPTAASKSNRREFKATHSSEPEKHEEFSQIVGSLLRAHSREEIIPRLVHHSVAELDAAIIRTKIDPNYKINGINTTGRTHAWFKGKAKQRKYWSEDRTQVGLVGLHSSSRQIQLDGSISANFGHSVQKFWNLYARRYRAADDYDRIHLRHEAIGTALLWFENSPKAEPFRRWFQQQFPGKDERGAPHWWMVAHEDLGFLFDEYGPAGTGRGLVAKKCKRQVLKVLALSSRNTPQIAKELHYSERQVRRCLRQLESEGLVHSAGEDCHKLWNLTKAADQDGANAEAETPDIHGNPVEGYHANCLPRAGRDKAAVGAKMVELPRKRSLKGMTQGQKNTEKRRRTYVNEVRGLKAQLRPVDLTRLLTLPLPHFEFWSVRMEDFRQEWGEYCRWRWVKTSPSRRVPEFNEWLSTQREKVYTTLPKQRYSMGTSQGELSIKKTKLSKIVSILCDVPF